MSWWAKFFQVLDSTLSYSKNFAIFREIFLRDEYEVDDVGIIILYLFIYLFSIYKHNVRLSSSSFENFCSDFRKIR